MQPYVVPFGVSAVVVVEIVEDSDAISTGQKFVYKMAANESGAAGYNDVAWIVACHALYRTAMEGERLAACSTNVLNSLRLPA